jgi:hypothetical protein
MVEYLPSKYEFKPQYCKANKKCNKSDCSPKSRKQKRQTLLSLVTNFVDKICKYTVL